MKGHVLVARAFLGPRPGRWVDVAHWDGNRANNRLSNLRYADRRENQDDAKRHGTAAVGVRHPKAKLNPDQVREIRRLKAETNITYRALAARFGVKHVAVLKAVKGDHWKPASMAILPKA